MKNEEFEKILLEIIKSLEERGYNPYDQLQGYLAKGDSSYITRHNGARDKIETLDKEQIKKYIRTRTVRICQDNSKQQEKCAS